MTREELSHLAHRWMAFWGGQGLDAFDDVHSPDFRDHGATGRAADRAAFKASVAELYEAFPDFHAVIDRLAIDDETCAAAVAWHARATHKGAFLGEAPTGASVFFRGVELIECRGGKVVGRWGEWDSAAILEQMRAGRG